MHSHRPNATGQEQKLFGAVATGLNYANRVARGRTAPNPKPAIPHQVDTFKLEHADGKFLIWNSFSFVIQPLNTAVRLSARGLYRMLFGMLARAGSMQRASEFVVPLASRALDACTDVNLARL